MVQNGSQPGLCNMDGPGGLYAEWNESDRKRHIGWYYLYMESKKKKKKVGFIEREGRMVVARGWKWGKEERLVKNKK